MKWIKLTHSTGADYINIEQIYKLVQSSPTVITIYDANSILPTSYAFATAQDLTDALAKFSSIVQVIDIDNLAPQG